MNQYVALARVSSREQEREGFSLDVQEDALRKFAERAGGSIIKMFRIAETASNREERQTFKGLLAYAKEYAQTISGVLFYKVDRAARNPFDFIELERLEVEFGVPIFYVAQPTEKSPSGRMQQRILANFASFTTEQQSVDVKEGMARRVQSGLFIGLAPYGYKNVRVDGRGLIEIDAEEGPRVKRIFELYAYHSHTLDSLIAALEAECAIYTRGSPRFPRSKIHTILRDRSYIGEVKHKDQWFAGKHTPLIDRATWDRVQVLLGEKVYRSHEMTYAGDLIRCGHCGHPITGERKFKKSKNGEREYIYYRCAKYNAAGHPRTRFTEAEMDQQTLGLFNLLKVKDERISKWFVKALHARAQHTQQSHRERLGELEKQMAAIRGQRDRLLNLRLADEIESATFAAKDTELRDRAAALKLQLDAVDRGHDEYTDLAVKAFELSQRLTEKWVTADYTAKRQILDIVCLNFTLDGTTLVPVWRKPFDVLADSFEERIGRGDRI